MGPGSPSVTATTPATVAADLDAALLRDSDLGPGWAGRALRWSNVVAGLLLLLTVRFAGSLRHGYAGGWSGLARSGRAGRDAKEVT